MKGDLVPLQPSFDFPKIVPPFPTDQDRIVLRTTWLGCSDVNAIDPPTIERYEILVNRKVTPACFMAADYLEMEDAIGVLPAGRYRLTYQEIYSFGTAPPYPIEPRFVEFTVSETHGVPTLGLFGAFALALTVCAVGCARRARGNSRDGAGEFR